MAVPHLTCLHGFSYFVSGLKSVAPRQGIDGGGGTWSFLELPVWSQEGTTDWEKDQTWGKGEQ